MIRRIVASSIVIANLIVGIGAVSAVAEDGQLLALNTVQTAPVAENTWRLTLAFGRADRSPNANARSVHAPALAPYDFAIFGADGIAAPFIVHEVTPSSGNEMTILIEYFGATPLSASAQFGLRVLDETAVATDRAAVTFDFLPPSLGGSDG